jgi:hypothetical protein
MTKYKMHDGTVIDTSKSSASWNETRESDGSNMIGVLTGSQWHYQTLYRSRKGRYYVEHLSCVSGQRDHVEWVSNEEACRWLLACDYDPDHADFPVDLKPLVDEIEQ